MFVQVCVGEMIWRKYGNQDSAKKKQEIHKSNKAFVKEMWSEGIES